MNIRPAHLLCAACVSICMAIPSFATGTMPAGAVGRVGPVRPAGIAGRGLPRSGRANRSPLAGPAPTGCGADESPYFVGLDPQENIAAGGYSGVVAGQDNEACDGLSGILTGFYNIIGSYDDGGASEFSVIVDGYDNTINASQDGFIGAGYLNSLSSGLIYGNGYSSAVVAGQQNAITSPYSFIGGGLLNSVAPSSLTTYLENSGQGAFIGTGYENRVSGNFSGVVSGYANVVAPDYSTVVGGQGNNIQVSSSGSAVSANSVIAGGVSNTIATTASTTNGQSAFIGAGSGNTVSANFASIVGGLDNNTAGRGSAIGGGQYSSISANASYSAIAGGAVNSAGAQFTAVGGGYENKAAGQGATVPGGQNNTAAGVDSFAARTASNAATNGAFVWSDDASGAKTVTATVANEFMARATGGFYLYSAANLSSGVKLAPGSGSWSSLSDRAAKTAIASVDDARILAKVAALPVSEWSYTAQGSAIRHLGPMAQDFRAAFGLGEDAKHISAVDEEGVALAAIKALQAEVAAKNRQITEQQRQLTEQHGQITEIRDARQADERRFSSLEKRLDNLEKQPSTASARSGR